MIMNVIQPIDDELIVIESDEDGLFEDGLSCIGRKSCSGRISCSGGMC